MILSGYSGIFRLISSQKSRTRSPALCADVGGPGRVWLLVTPTERNARYLGKRPLLDAHL